MLDRQIFIDFQVLSDKVAESNGEILSIDFKFVELEKMQEKVLFTLRSPVNLYLSLNIFYLIFHICSGL